MYRISLSFLAILLYCICGFSQDEQIDSTGEAAKPKIPEKITFILGKGNDVSANSDNKWLGALIEAYLEFKLLPVEKFTFVNPDSIASLIPSHHYSPGTPSESDYMRVAARVKADYIGNMKYELTKDKNVFIYMEIESIKDKEIFSTVERQFQINRIGYELDIIIAELLKSFKIEPPKELARFEKFPAVGEDPKTLKELGDCIYNERFVKNPNTATITDSYMKICEKDRSMLIAYYRGGLYFNSVERYADASEALNILFSVVPEFTPLYAPLCQSFRKARKFEDAIRIALVGEQHGVKTNDLFLERGLAYEEMGKKEEAAKAFEQLLNGNPNEPHVLLFYARSRNDAGNPKGSLEYSERLIKLNLETGYAYMEKGRSLALLSRPNEALNAFTTAASLLPGSVEVQAALGDLYLSSKQYSRAAQAFEKVLPKANDNVDIYLKTANAMSLSGDNKKALSVLRQIEPRFTNHGVLLRELGVLELATNDTVKAKMHLEACQRAGVEDERVLMGLGWIYLNSNDPVKAQIMFTRAMPLIKDKSEAKLGLALVAIKRGDLSTAIPLFEEISAIADKFPGINKQIGDACLAKGDKSRALSYYKKERAISKADTALQNKIAGLAYESSTALDALNEYVTLEKMGSAGTDNYYRMCMLSLKLKNGQEAQRYLAKASKAGSATPDIYLQVGKGFSSLGMKQSALEVFQSCIRKDPANEAAYTEYISLLMEMKQESEAAEACLKLFALNNQKYKDKLSTAGLLFEKCGMKDKAASAYSLFLEKKFTDPEISIRYAQILYTAKKYQTVVDVLQNVPLSSLTSEALLMMLAESYCNVNMYDKALKPLSAVLTRNPKQLKAIELSAIANEKSGNLDESIQMYKKFLSFAGLNAEYAYHLGELYEKQKMIPQAISRYEENTTRFPDDFRNFDRLARLRYESKNYVEAIPVLQKALNFKEASPELREMLAKSQIQSGSTEGGIDNLRAYLQTNGNDSLGWMELGNQYYKKKDYKNAAVAYEKASGLMKNNPAVYRLAGTSYFNAGELSSAVGPLKKARESQKQDPIIIEMLAKCYRENKNTGDLISILKDWASIDKKNYDIRRELADLLIGVQKISDAAVVLEEAASLKQCPTEINILLAQIYEKQGNKEKWLASIKAASACSPKDGDLYFKIGKYYADQKNKILAQSYFEKTIQLIPGHAEAHYRLGAYLMADNKIQEAASHLSQAVRAEQGNDVYATALTEALYKLGRRDEALRVIRGVVSKDKAEPEALRWAGLLYKEAGKKDTAKQILQDAVLANRNCGDCCKALGDINYDEANYSDAAKNYQSAMEILGFNEDMAVKLSQSYIRIGKTDQAAQLYEKIISNNPQNTEILYRLVHYYIANEKIEKAKQVMSKSVKVSSGWYNLANAEVLEAQDNMKYAAGYYLKALSALPSVPEALAGCGRVSIDKKDYSSAIMYLGQAMAGDAENVQYMIDMGKAYEGSGELSGAMDLYQEALRRKPDNPEVYYVIARIDSRKRDHKKAIEILMQGINQTRKDGLLYYALGHEYRIMQRYDESIDAYLKAVRSDKDQFKDAYKYIGSVYYSKQDQKSAKKYFELYINAGGQDPKVQKLLKRL